MTTGYIRSTHLFYLQLETNIRCQKQQMFSLLVYTRYNILQGEFDMLFLAVVIVLIS
jgi:hypothetical protein